MLTIQRVPQSSGAMVLQLAGTLTLGNSCQELEWEVDALLREGCNLMVFDLAKLTRIDSAGIGIVVRSSGKMNAGGRQFRVAGASGGVAEVVKLTRIDAIVDFYPDVPAALAGAKSAGA